MDDTLRFMVILAILWTICTQETIHQCFNGINGQLKVKTVESWHSNNKHLHLIESADPTNWCQASRSCRQLGMELAEMSHNFTIPEAYIQRNKWTWIAGRRKDFGNNWTWLEDNLYDFEDGDGGCFSFDAKTNEGEDASIVLTKGWCRFNNKNRTGQYFLCHPRQITHSHSAQPITWMQAQRICHTHSGRLASEVEIDRSWASESSRQFWIGLAYRPWIWVRQCDQSDRCFKPVVNFVNDINMNSTSGYDCLSMDTKSKAWRARWCDEHLQFFLCEGSLGSFTPLLPLLTSDSSTDTAQGSPALPTWAGVLIGIAISIGITGVILGIVYGFKLSRCGQTRRKMLPVADIVSSRKETESGVDRELHEPANDQISYTKPIAQISSIENPNDSNLQYEEIKLYDMTCPRPSPGLRQMAMFWKPKQRQDAQIGTGSHPGQPYAMPQAAEMDQSSEHYCEPQPHYLTTCGKRMADSKQYVNN